MKKELEEIISKDLKSHSLKKKLIKEIDNLKQIYESDFRIKHNALNNIEEIKKIIIFNKPFSDAISILQKLQLDTEIQFLSENENKKFIKIYHLIDQIRSLKSSSFFF